MGRSTPQTILIVDDDTALLDALPTTVRLRLPEAEIVTAASAYQALELLQQTDFDVVVSDIKMPGIDGLQLLEKLRTIRSDTPAVLISGHGDRDLTIQALRVGAYDFVQKPIDRDYFIVTLRNALHTRNLRREVAAQQEALAQHARELAAKVEERTRQLQAANDVKDEFLGIISHEMRTPLTILSGGVDVLLEADRHKISAEARRELLEDMRREGDRLITIVEDLLVLARAGLNHGDAEPARLERLLERLVAKERTRTGRSIQLAFSANLPLVAAEPTYLERIVDNLLTNASKYSAEGGQIDVRVEELNGAWLCVSVLDQGQPISPEEIERFFQPFYRAPDARERAGGFGIGLGTCKRLVNAFGGKIWAVPREGGGLQVSFTLPVYLTEEDRPP